ncbi:MAG: hypothetical protein EXR77_19585, partial [Myxococcales bacterium]|nr:hypothetical protein [Myxococcales bacterium]
MHELIAVRQMPVAMSVFIAVRPGQALPEAIARVIVLLPPSRVLAAMSDSTKSTEKPLIIGIAGGTGAGKTTIARTVVAELAGESVTLVEHDHYYRDRGDLEYEARCLLNYDHPDSLESELMAAHLDALCRGEIVLRPNYD